MSGTYPRKTHCETLFAGHTPSSVGFRCKGSEKFWIGQEKSDFGTIFLGCFLHMSKLNSTFAAEN